MATRPRKWLRRLRRVLVLFLLLVCALCTFGISGHDEASFRNFAEAAVRWQVNPKFRAIAGEYCEQGSAAAHCGFCCIPVRRLIMDIRSLPGLPKEYAVNPTSRLHYENFSRGPLSAYLHLCSEQDINESIAVMEQEARKGDYSDAEMGRMLATFKMDFPVANDRGARESMASTFRDSDAARPFVIRKNIGEFLDVPIRNIAADLNIPGDVNNMTFEQQRAVFDRLDGYIHVHDSQLWRTKQMSDFFAGIWAQVYGPPYNTIIVPVLMLHDICRILLVVLLCLISLGHWRHKRRAARLLSDNTTRLESPEAVGV